MYWRLTLDVPYDFATEPGAHKAVFCRNFRAEGEAYSDTWRDPVTGVVMLKPSFQKREWHDYQKPLAQWLYQPTFWRTSKRTVDLVEGFTNVKPSGADVALIELQIGLAALAIDGYIAGYDDLKWALQSNFLLEPDESFAISYFPITDELIRKRNWMAIAWDNIGIHLSQQGVATVYKYDRNDITAAPTFQYDFEFAAPSEMAHKVGYLVFIPVPRLGLLFYHSHSMPRTQLNAGDAESIVQRGHLLPWDSVLTGEDYYRMFESSPISIAINPYQEYHLAFTNIRYPSSGTFLDAPLDPGYQPSALPSSTETIMINTQNPSALMTLRNVDDTADWDPAADRKGRAKVTLSSSDAIHTPFLLGYGALWDPVRATRDTTPVVATVQELEMTDDTLAVYEGAATLKVEDAGIEAICKRGDATFLLENSDDGITYSTYVGGLAKKFDLDTHVDASGTWYTVRCRLFSMHERLREIHGGDTIQTAFDGVYPGDGINVVLRCAGFEEITPPAALQLFTLPPFKDTGNQWRYAVREGDDGEEIVNKLLLYGRAQYSEYRMRWDWDAETWICEARARDTSAEATWTLTPYSADHDPANRIARISSFKWRPYPPECNVLVVEGATQPDAQGKRQTLIVQNYASVEDDTSVDYLGRVKLARVPCKEITDKTELQRMARRIEALAMHRSLVGTVEMPDFFTSLAPNVYVQPVDDEENVLGSFWIKRRTVKVIPGGPTGYQEYTTYELDSIWEGEIPT